MTADATPKSSICQVQKPAPFFRTSFYSLAYLFPSFVRPQHGIV